MSKLGCEAVGLRGRNGPRWIRLLVIRRRGVGGPGCSQGGSLAAGQGGTEGRGAALGWKRLGKCEDDAVMGEDFWSNARKPGYPTSEGG